MVVWEDAEVTVLVEYLIEPVLVSHQDQVLVLVRSVLLGEL